MNTTPLITQLHQTLRQFAIDNNLRLILPPAQSDWDEKGAPVSIKQTVQFDFQRTLHEVVTKDVASGWPIRPPQVVELINRQEGEEYAVISTVQAVATADLIAKELNVTHKHVFDALKADGLLLAMPTLRSRVYKVQSLDVNRPDAPLVCRLIIADGRPFLEDNEVNLYPHPEMTCWVPTPMQRRALAERSIVIMNNGASGFDVGQVSFAGKISYVSVDYQFGNSTETIDVSRDQTWSMLNRLKPKVAKPDELVKPKAPTKAARHKARKPGAK